MENRRTFLSLVTSSGVALSLLAREASAQSATPAAPPDTPAPKATAKPASAAAVALAATMRRFDAKLTDAELETIARGIDAQRELGPALSPKKKPLRNADEPLPAVRIPDPSA